MKWLIVYLLYVIGIGEQPDLKVMGIILLLNFVCFLICETYLKKYYKKKIKDFGIENIKFTFNFKDLF